MEYVLAILGQNPFSFRKAFFPVVVFLRHIADHFIPHQRNNYHPHILGNRAMALFSGLLVCLKVFTVILVSIGPVLPAFSSAINIENVISLTNQSRASFNLPTLIENSVLNQAAQAKANDMLAKGYFAHNTPDGKTPWDFFASAGYNYLMAGENLAVNFTEAENVEDAWMNSPGHKANILNKNFEEIGIGISQGSYLGHNTIFVVQLFGTPVEQKVKLLDTPTVVKTQSVPVPVQPVRAAVAASALSNNVKADTTNKSSPVAGTTPASEVTPPLLPELAVSDAQVSLNGDTVNISATTNETAVKVFANFGESAIMLTPKSNTLWQGSVDLQKLAHGNLSVKIVAQDISGNQKTRQLADFSSGTVANYNILGATSSSKVNWLGRVFDPKAFESKFYLLFITAILISMVLAIGIKRHVQHLSLIANSSFVVILASLLFMAR